MNRFFVPYLLLNNKYDVIHRNVRAPFTVKIYLQPFDCKAPPNSSFQPVNGESLNVQILNVPFKFFHQTYTTQ